MHLQSTRPVNATAAAATPTATATAAAATATAPARSDAEALLLGKACTCCHGAERDPDVHATWLTWADGACREAESIQNSSPRRQQSGLNKTTRRVERMLFLMENAHCATAGDTEQNGAKQAGNQTGAAVATMCSSKCCHRLLSCVLACAFGNSSQPN